MWFPLGNTNIRIGYSLLMNIFDIKVDVDKHTGIDTYVIKLESIEDYVQLYNVCKIYNPYFRGLIYKDGRIIIDDGQQLKEC